MRFFLLQIVCLILAGCISINEKPHQNKAQIGQTQTQISKQLGQPAANYMNGFHVYNQDGNEVQVHFSHGKADAIFYYTFEKRISDALLKTILSQNSNAAPWVQEASSSKTGRVAYRTKDGKHHAFVSNGNQLLVDTDSFFQKSVHRPGKIIPIDSLPEGVFAPDHPDARIGDHESEVIKQYGPPVAISNDNQKLYSDGYRDIMVHFKNGRCDKVLYAADKGRKLKDTWISCLLDVNAPGHAWIVSEKTPQLPKYYWVTCPESAPLIAYLVEGKILRVMAIDTHTKAGGRRKKPFFYSSIPPCASVWLGKTEAEMAKKLGRPKVEDKDMIYQDHEVEVRAGFDQGGCCRISYQSKKQKFSDHWITATLALNSGGGSWFVYEGGNSKAIFYRTFDKKFYATLKNGKALTVMSAAAHDRCLKSAGDRQGRKLPRS